MNTKIKSSLKKIWLINILNRLYWRLVVIASEKHYRDTLNYKIAKQYLNFLFFREGEFNGLALDVGCASGRNVFALNMVGIKAYGIDIKPRFNLWDLMNNRFLIADGYQIPFRDNIFDKVLCLAVLEHVSNDDSILKEIWRVLKDNGEAIFLVPNISYSKNKVDSSHLREYTIEQISNKLKKNNFSIARIKTRYIYSKYFTVSLNSFLSLIHLFGSKYHWFFFNCISKLVPERKRAHIYINAFKAKSNS